MKNPKLIMQMGMVAVIASLAWTRFVHPTAAIGEDMIDGVHGFLTGVAITLLGISAYMHGRMRVR